MAMTTPEVAILVLQLRIRLGSDSLAPSDWRDGHVCIGLGWQLWKLAQRA